MAHLQVLALKSWGGISVDDTFNVEEGQARRWAHKSRVKILGPAEGDTKPEEDDAPDPKKRKTKPEGPSETKPQAPEKTKSVGPVLEKAESGPGWYHVLVDGEAVTKPDGQPKNFRESDADAFIKNHG